MCLHGHTVDGELVILKTQLLFINTGKRFDGLTRTELSVDTNYG
jgi:hypothetical protein